MSWTYSGKLWLAKVPLSAGLAELAQVLRRLAYHVRARERRALKDLLADEAPAADLVAQRLLEAGVAFLVKTRAQQRGED